MIAFAPKCSVKAVVVLVPNAFASLIDIKMTWEKFGTVGSSQGTQHNFSMGRVIIGKYADGDDCVLVWTNNGWPRSKNTWLKMPKVCEIIKELKIDLARPRTIDFKVIEEVLKSYRWHSETFVVKNIGDPKDAIQLEKLVKRGSIDGWGLF